MKRAAVGRFLGGVLALACAAAPAAPLPAPFEAEYAGSRFPMKATATVSLSRLGDYYRYTMRALVRMAFFEVTHTYDCSVMRVRDGALYPLEYVHRDARDKDRGLHIRFAWPDRKVRVERGDGTVREIEGVEPPAFDLMSIQVRLRADAAAAEPGAEFVYAIVGKDDVTRHRATFEGMETLHLDGTALRAAKMVSRGPKRTNAFWFAPDHAWLPLRIGVGDVALELVSPPGEAGREAAPPPARAPGCE